MAELNCWNCGTLLNDIPRPISRHASCPKCFHELHCCRQCSHYDPGITGAQCDEERADPPVIKGNANFCDWFRPRAGGFQQQVGESREHARARLDALFGDEPDGSDGTDDAGSVRSSPEDEARAKLDRLFSAKPSSEQEDR